MLDFAETVPGKIISMVEHDGCLYVATDTGVFRSVAHNKFYEVQFMAVMRPLQDAAAPDLLAALRSLVYTVEYNGLDNHKDAHDLNNAMKRARAAIAQATRVA